jgi:hypothetical protein
MTTWFLVSCKGGSVPTKAERGATLVRACLIASHKAERIQARYTRILIEEFGPFGHLRTVAAWERDRSGHWHPATSKPTGYGHAGAFAKGA